MKYAIDILKKRLVSLTNMEVYTKKRPSQSFTTLEEIYKERKDIGEALKKIESK